MQNKNGNKDWKFFCKICHYGCSKKYLFSQHTKTKKHEMLINAQSLHPHPEIPTPLHQCKCGKTYKHVQSYTRHSKTCNKSSLVADSDNTLTTKDIHGLLTSLSEQYKNIVIENTEMRKLVADLLPHVGNNTTIHNQFNIQMFLNTQCKDALNLTDFIETLKLDHNDFCSSKENGQCNGIADIFLRGLKALDLHKRPIHCSDLKREVLYVKDDGVWEKENEENCKLKGAITSIAKKQIHVIKIWEEAHPNWQHNEKSAQEYCRMVQQLTSPNNETEENKIIKTIAKEVIFKQV